MALCREWIRRGFQEQSNKVTQTKTKVIFNLLKWIILKKTHVAEIILLHWQEDIKLSKFIDMPSICQSWHFEPQRITLCSRLFVGHITDIVLWDMMIVSNSSICFFSATDSHIRSVCWNQLKISCLDTKSGASGLVTDSHKDFIELMFEDWYQRDKIFLNDNEFISVLLKQAKKLLSNV